MGWRNRRHYLIVLLLSPRALDHRDDWHLKCTIQSLTRQLFKLGVFRLEQRRTCCTQVSAELQPERGLTSVRQSCCFLPTRDWQSLNYSLPKSNISR